MIFATVGSNRVRCHWCYCAVRILFLAVAVLKKRLILKTNAKKLPINPVFFLSIKASIYQCKEKGEIKLLQAYVDADVSLAAS